MELSRLGEEKLNNKNSPMKIIEYKNSKDILVQFQDEHGCIVHTDYRRFLNGNVKNVYSKSLYNIGYLGNSCIHNENKKIKNSYYTWAGMIRRCYSEEYKTKHPTYYNAKVCKEWLCYENFEKWYDENYYEIDNEKMCLDKDILVKGNKIYSPETCIFIPHLINSFLTKSDMKRGKYPIGVSFYKRYNKYVSYCTINSKRKTIGYFENEIDAFCSYKQTKENYIKDIANKYKCLIPNNVYLALMTYSICIDD